MMARTSPCIPLRPSVGGIMALVAFIIGCLLAILIHRILDHYGF